MRNQVSLNGRSTKIQGKVVTTTTHPSDKFFLDVRPNRTRSRKPVGRLPCKSYTMFHGSYSPSYGQSYRVDTVPVAYFFGDLDSERLPFSENWTPSTSLRSKAEIQALLALKDQRVNYGVALAEAGKTAEFLGSAARRIASGYRRLRRLDPKGAVRALFGGPGDIPSRWLEYQYGLTPLLNDVRGTVEELQRAPEQDWVIRVQGRSTVSLDDLAPHPNGAMRGGCLRDVKMTGFETCLVVLYYRPQSYALASLSRLGLANPAEIVWELTPFSFVLDWFLPVGSWLSSLDAAVGYEFLDGCHTAFRRESWRTIPRDNPGVAVWTGPTPVGSCKAVGMQRGVYSSSPIPQFPRPRLGLSLTRMANGLAMLSQVFQRKR